MSRINTNIQSLIAQRVLTNNAMGLNTALERLSTGLRINRGKDDPAGLIASEGLRAELRATTAAISNAERADQVVNIAEGGLQEVSGLLTELQGLLTSTASSAGLSAEEKQANQLQIDSILQTIDRIASATSFQGIKLLNGNFDFRVSGVATGIADYKINGAKFAGSSLNVNVQITTSAQQAGLYLSFGATSIDLSAGFFVFEVAGSKGARELAFTSGTTTSSIAAAINSFKDVTGVEASVSGNGLEVFSTAYGSNEYVTVKIVDDAGLAATGSRGIYRRQAAAWNSSMTSGVVAWTASGATTGVRDNGQNVAATINGIATTADGKAARINTDFLDVEVTFTASQSQTLGAVGSGQAFTITGGGADFQLSGKVDLAGKVSLGIGDVAVRKLGKAETAAGVYNYLSDLGSNKALNVVNGSLPNAQKVVEEAIATVSVLRGRLGAFQKNTVGATIRSLGIAVENTAAAQSVIRDADFAAETAQLTRNQILVSASTQILTLANQQPQIVLQLLG